MKEHWRQQAEGAKWRFVIILAFILGIGSMIGIRQVLPFQTNVFSPEVCRTFAEIDLDRVQLFLQCFMKRCGIFFVLLMLFYSKWGAKTFFLYIVWQFFCLGLSMELLAMEYGTWGMGLFVVGCSPQLYIYAFAYILLYRLGGSIIRENKTNLGKILILFLVVIIGVLFESYVNPSLVKIYLNLFLESFYNI